MKVQCIKVKSVAEIGQPMRIRKRERTTDLTDLCGSHILKQYNCDECKHRFACLTDPHGDRTFESAIGKFCMVGSIGRQIRSTRKYYLIPRSGWFEIEEPSRHMFCDFCMELWLDKVDRFDCNQCKHKLTCLMKTDCNQTFESK